MFKRLLLGLVKGLVLGGVVGAAITFGLHQSVGGVAAYALYALLGALAGVFAGRPPWMKGAWVESLLKGLFGVAVGAGLYALGSRFLNFPMPNLATGQGEIALAMQPMLMAPGIGAIYAALIELDNTGEADSEPTNVRIRSVDDIKVDEDEEVDAAQSRGSSKARR
jgi:hypothetical protein